MTQPSLGTRIREAFRSFAHGTSAIVGSPWAFGIALAICVGWAFTGPIFHYSDTWQLVINTGTTIVTFLMVFLIQNTQNRDAIAIHLKLDELIRAVADARTGALVDAENLSDEEIEKLQREFKRERAAAARAVRLLPRRRRAAGSGRRGRRKRQNTPRYVAQPRHTGGGASPRSARRKSR